MYERSIKALRLSNVSLEDKCTICKRLLSTPNLWPPPGPPILDHALFILTTNSAKGVPSLLEQYWGFVRQLIPNVDLSPSHYSLLCDAASKHVHDGPSHLVSEVFRCLRIVCTLSQYWPISIESSACLLETVLGRVSKGNILQNFEDATEVCKRLATSHAFIQSRHDDVVTVIGIFLDHLLEAFAHSAHELQSCGVKLLMEPTVSSSAKSQDIVKTFNDRCEVVSRNMTFVAKAFIDAINLKTGTSNGTSMENETPSAMNEERTSEAKKLIQTLLTIIQHCLGKSDQAESLHDESVIESLSMLFSKLHTLKFSVLQSTLRPSWKDFALSEGERLVQRIILLLCQLPRSAPAKAPATLKALAAIMGAVSLFSVVRQDIFGLITDENVRTLAEPQHWELLLCSCVKAGYRENLIPELFESFASAAVTGGEHVTNLFLNQKLLGSVAEAVRLLPRTHSLGCIDALRRFTNGTHGVTLILSTVVVESTGISELADVVAASLELLDQIQQSHYTDRGVASFEIYLLGSLIIATSRAVSQDSSKMVAMVIRSLNHSESHLSSQSSLVSLLEVCGSYPKTADGFELYCVLRILSIFTLSLLNQKENETIVRDFARMASKFYDALLKPEVKQGTIPFLGRSTREEATNHINALRAVLQRHEYCAVINFMSVDSKESRDCDQKMRNAEPIRVEHFVISIDEICTGPLVVVNKVSSILREVLATLSSGTGLSDGNVDFLTEALDTAFREVRTRIEFGTKVIADSATCLCVTKLSLLVICARNAYRSVSSSRGEHLVHRISLWILSNLQNLLVLLLDCTEKADEILPRSHCLSALIFLCLQVVDDKLAGADAFSAVFGGIIRLIAAKDAVLHHAGISLSHIIARRSSEGLKLICDVLTVPAVSTALRGQAISILTKGVLNWRKHDSSLSVEDTSKLRRLSDIVRLVRFEAIDKDEWHTASAQWATDTTFSGSFPSSASMCILCGSNTQAVYAIAHHARPRHSSVEANVSANAAEHYLCSRCLLRRVKSWKHLRVLRQVRNMGVRHSNIREEAELVGENISRELLKGMVADIAVECVDRVANISTNDLDTTGVLDELAISHDVSQAHITAALQQKRGQYKGR